MDYNEDKLKTLYKVEDGQICCISNVMCEDCENNTTCKPLPDYLEKLLLNLEDKSWMKIAR